MAGIINFEEWFSELQRLGTLSSQNEEDAYTCDEIRGATGKSDKVVRNMLRIGLTQGHIVLSRKSMMSISGVERHVPAYRFVARDSQKD